MKRLQNSFVIRIVEKWNFGYCKQRYIKVKVSNTNVICNAYQKFLHLKLVLIDYFNMLVLRANLERRKKPFYNGV